MAFLKIKVVPSSSKNEIQGWYGYQIKLKVQAPPERGKANKSVLKLLSSWLHVKTGDLRIVSGEVNASKVVEIAGMSDGELDSRLNERLSN